MFDRSDSEDFQLKGYDIAPQAIAELKDMTYKLVFVGAAALEALSAGLPVLVSGNSV